MKLAHSMLGNEDRLREYMTRCSPTLLFTLGTEAAAFVRNEAFETVAASVAQLFYADRASMEFMGARVDVVHLVHPHLFLKRNETWMRRHNDWVVRAGRELASAHRAG